MNLKKNLHKEFKRFRKDLIQTFIGMIADVSQITGQKSKPARKASPVRKAKKQAKKASKKK